MNLFLTLGQYLTWQIGRGIGYGIGYVAVAVFQLVLWLARNIVHGLRWAAYRYRMRGESDQDGRGNVVRFSPRRDVR